MSPMVAKWGNSLGVRLPAHVTKKAGINQGDIVDIKAGRGRSVIISPTRPQYTLEVLVSKITPQNVHGTVDWGKPEGNEAW